MTSAFGGRARGTATGTAADLIPAIRTGIVAAGTPAAGERFIQPRLGEGDRLLDDATGHGWRLVTNGDGLLVDAERAVAGTPVVITIVDARRIGDDGALLRWLDERGVAAVLVRPDFYVFGTGDPADLVSALTAALWPAAGMTA